MPILREVALRQNFATAVGALARRFPTIYGALAPTKPLSEVTVRLWFEPGPTGGSWNRRHGRCYLRPIESQLRAN